MDEEDDSIEQTPESFLLVSVVLELGLGVVAVVLGVLLGPDPRDVLPLPGQWGQILTGIGLGVLAAIPLLIVVQLLEHLPIKSIQDLQKATEERLLGAMSKLRTVDLLTVSICAGVGEELLFRGWLMMSLSGPMNQWTTGPLVAAVVISSLVFGIAHPITPAYIVVTGLIGVFMAMLLVWTGNLLVPITAHAFYDFIQLVLATRALRTETANQ